MISNKTGISKKNYVFAKKFHVNPNILYRVGFRCLSDCGGHTISAEVSNLTDNLLCFLCKCFNGSLKHFI